MSEALKAADWLRKVPADGKKQAAMFERVAQLLTEQQRQIELLARREGDLATEVMEQRAILGAMRAVADPHWRAGV